MKKTLCLILAFCFILLTGCGGNQPSGSSPTLSSDKNSSGQASSTENKVPLTPEIDPDNDPYENVSGSASPLLPIGDQKKFVLTSAIGTWSTVITLKKDGSFEGEYEENLPDVSAEAGYANGNKLVCSFSGKFSDFKRIDDFTYAMKLSELLADYAPDEYWIEDEVLYTTASPAGIENGYIFYLYLPGKPTAEIDERAMEWYLDGKVPATLDKFAIMNQYDAGGYTATYMFFG